MSKSELFLDFSEWKEVYSSLTPQKILLVFPRFPLTMHSLRFFFEDIAKGSLRAPSAPLQNLIVAAFLPKSWELRLVDENVRPITDEDLLWADVVIASAEQAQIDSFDVIADRAHAFGKPVVVGGLDPSLSPHFYGKADYLHIGRVGDATKEMIFELNSGAKLQDKQKVFTVNKFIHLEDYPCPRYDLINVKEYLMMAVQTTEGCPFDCEFCDVVVFYGHTTISKRPKQVTDELTVLYDFGYRGAVWFIDDNFAGDVSHAQKLLPQVIGWQRNHDYPFAFFTSASVNMAEHPDLLNSMREAGFFGAFIGMESPDPIDLKAISKPQNMYRPLLESVEIIRSYGIEPVGAFILGLDTDTPESVDKLVYFVEKANIVAAQIYLLMGVQGTRTYKRLATEGRIMAQPHKSPPVPTNLLYKIGQKEAFAQLREAWRRIYEPRTFFARIRRNIATHKTGDAPFSRVTSPHFSFSLAWRLIWRLGILSDYRFSFWKTCFLSIVLGRIKLFMFWALYAYHLINFRRVVMDKLPPVMPDETSYVTDFNKLPGGIDYARCGECTLLIY